MQAPIGITGFAEALHLSRNDSFRRVRGFARETYLNFTKLRENHLDEEVSQKATRFIEQAEAGNIDCSYLGKDLSARPMRIRGQRNLGGLNQWIENRKDQLWQNRSDRAEPGRGYHLQPSGS